MLNFIKMMAAAGCDISGYVKSGTITAEQKDEILNEVNAGG